MRGVNGREAGAAAGFSQVPCRGSPAGHFAGILEAPRAGCACGELAGRGGGLCGQRQPGVGRLLRAHGESSRDSGSRGGRGGERGPPSGGAGPEQPDRVAAGAARGGRGPLFAARAVPGSEQAPGAGEASRIPVLGVPLAAAECLLPAGAGRYPASLTPSRRPNRGQRVSRDAPSPPCPRTSRAGGRGFPCWQRHCARRARQLLLPLAGGNWEWAPGTGTRLLQSPLLAMVNRRVV